MSLSAEDMIRLYKTHSIQGSPSVPAQLPGAEQGIQFQHLRNNNIQSGKMHLKFYLLTF